MLAVQANLEDKLKNSKTGRPIPAKVLADYTKEEDQKEIEVQKVRLRHLMLKAQLAKIDHRVKQKVLANCISKFGRLACMSVPHVYTPGIVMYTQHNVPGGQR